MEVSVLSPIEMTPKDGTAKIAAQPDSSDCAAISVIPAQAMT